MEDEIMRELHRVRAEIASEHGNDWQKLVAHYQNLSFPGFTYGIPGRIFRSEEERKAHIDERNRQFKRRQALKAVSDGKCPHGQCHSAATETG